MATSSIYLRFLDLLSQVNKKYDLTTREIDLLNYVFLAQSNKQEIRVKDLISLDHLGTQATLHSALSSLVKKKFIKATTSTLDRRNKHLELTNLAKTRYAQIERAINQSVNNK